MVAGGVEKPTCLGGVVTDGGNSVRMGPEAGRKDGIGQVRVSFPKRSDDRLAVNGEGDGTTHAHVGQDRVPEVESQVGRIAPRRFLHHQAFVFQDGGEQVGVDPVQDEVDAALFQFEEPHVAVGEEFDDHPFDPRGPAVVCREP